VDPAAFNLGDRALARPPIPVWPDMVEPLALFYDAPWNWVSLGLAGAIRTHINRTELETSARLLDVKMTPDVFADIRVMEEQALLVWSRKRV